MSDSFETFHWEQLARRQKLYIGAAVLVVCAVIVGVVWDSVQARLEAREYERQAAQAARDKDEALKAVAKIASEVKIREEELTKVEGKRDAKSDEVKVAGTAVKSARAEYDRAVKSRRADIPSTDQLCRELADAGHPCNPQ